MTCYHRGLHVQTHPFPTRRSSELVDATTGKRLSAVTSAVYPEQPDGRHRSEGTIQFAEWMPNSDELSIDGMGVNKDGRRHGAGSPVRNLNVDAYYGNDIGRAHV